MKSILSTQNQPEISQLKGGHQTYQHSSLSVKSGKSEGSDGAIRGVPKGESETKLLSKGPGSAQLKQTKMTEAA